MAEDKRIKPGPVPRGDREALTARWPKNDRDFIRSESKRLGLSEGSYVIKEFLEGKSRALPSWLVDEIRQGAAKARALQEQEELPLARSA